MSPFAILVENAAVGLGLKESPGFGLGSSWDCLGSPLSALVEEYAVAHRSPLRQIQGG